MNKDVTHFHLIHIYDGILFSHEKEEHSAISRNVDGPWEHYAFGNESDQMSKDTALYHFYIESNRATFVEFSQARKVHIYKH